MKPETIGWIAAIAGSLLGIAGGAFGTYTSIRNTKGPKERAFVIRAASACWLLVAVFAAVVFLAPVSVRAFVWIPFVALLVSLIPYWNRRQAWIRKQESQEGARS